MGFRERLETSFTLLSGMAIGALAMFLFDEHSGSRRRARLRDKVVRAGHVASRFADKRSRDLKNRAYGVVAETRARMREKNVDDRELEERARAQLGHAVSHPGSLEVIARDGRVTVCGPLLRGEDERIQKRLRQTRGVRDVDLQVDVYESPGDIPELQGGSRWQRKQRVG